MRICTITITKGVFAIENDFSLNGMEGTLTIHKDHEIDIENLEYHKEHIFINHQK